MMNEMDQSIERFLFDFAAASHYFIKVDHVTIFNTVCRKTVKN